MSHMRKTARVEKARIRVWAHRVVNSSPGGGRLTVEMQSPLALALGRRDARYEMRIEMQSPSSAWLASGLGLGLGLGLRLGVGVGLGLEFGLTLTSVSSGSRLSLPLGVDDDLCAKHKGGRTWR